MSTFLFIGNQCFPHFRFLFSPCHASRHEVPLPLPRRFRDRQGNVLFFCRIVFFFIEKAFILMCNEFVGCVPCKTSTLNFLYVFNGYSVDLSKTFISWNHFKIYSQIKLTFCKIFCEQLWECDLMNHNLIIGGHA